MGLGRLFHRNVRYDVTDTVTGSSQTFVIDGGRMPLSPLWPSADYRGAMGLPGAWRCAVLLSDLLGSVPWRALRQRGDAPVEVVASSLLEQPSPPDTRMDTFAALALDLLFHGNAIALYAARNSDGYPTAMLPVPATSVGVRRAGAGDPFPLGAVVYDVNGEVDGRQIAQTFAAADVLHVKGPSRPGALRGMGVLETHFDTLSLASEQASEARALTEHAVPTGVLKSENPDLTKPEADALKAGWRESQRSRTVAVLNATTSYEALAWDPSKTQLLDARKFSVHEIGLIFGMPLSFLGVEQGTLTYSNVETEALNLVKFTLAGHLARFEQALSLAFPRNTYVKANLDSLLRADTKTRYEAHEIAMRAGFLTDDEVRGLEDRPPLTAAQRARMRPVGTVGTESGRPGTASGREQGDDDGAGQGDDDEDRPDPDDEDDDEQDGPNGGSGRRSRPDGTR